MPDPLTIPAAHLNALGMEGSDPPVRFTDAKGRQWSWHPDDCDCDGDDVLNFGDEFGERLEDGAGPVVLVEHSMPALLRALARQYGSKLKPGAVPDWYEDFRGAWWLVPDQGEGQSFLPPTCAAKHDHDHSVPTLVGGMGSMGRLEALAAVIAWQVSQ